MHLKISRAYLLAESANFKILFPILEDVASLAENICNFEFGFNQESGDLVLL